MTNNDVLRRIRYTFSLTDKKMIALFAAGGLEATRAEVSEWLKKDEDPDFKKCTDLKLARFLNGFIIEHRGKKEGEEPVAETRLTNNIIFRKLKIALNLTSDDILALLLATNFRLGKSELSAFFRKPTHALYRECQDQILRNFLQALLHKHHKPQP
jgi:uncharacterized protein YehS (DUF1456 family)